MILSRLLQSLPRSILYSVQWKNRCNAFTGIFPVRPFYSEKFLGISDYEEQRMKKSTSRFDKTKLEHEMYIGDTGKLLHSTVETIYMVDKSLDNVLLIRKSLQRILRNPDLAQNFAFGPLVMRMLHYFNMPEIALQFYEDKQLQCLYDKLSSVLVLCDLLFENGRYDKVFEISKSRLDMNSRYLFGMLFAACYKLNTPDHLIFAVDIWQKLPDANGQLLNSINLLALLAINQNEVTLALDILPNGWQNQSSTNVRLLALCKMNAIDLLFDTLKNILREDSKIRISHELVKAIESKLAAGHQSLEIVDQFNQIRFQLKARKKFIDVTIEDMVLWPLIHLDSCKDSTT